MRNDGKYFTFDEHGNPQPHEGKPFAGQQMMEYLSTALAVPYADEPLDTEKLTDLPMGAVGALRTVKAYADGDLEAAKFVHDRILGKPKQQIESLNVHMDIFEYVKSLPPPTPEELAVITFIDKPDEQLLDIEGKVNVLDFI